MMDELYKALETIKKECSKYNFCTQCPLRGCEENSCAVRESSPVRWKIENTEIPRLFK